MMIQCKQRVLTFVELASDPHVASSPPILISQLMLDSLTGQKQEGTGCFIIKLWLITKMSGKLLLKINERNKYFVASSKKLSKVCLMSIWRTSMFTKLFLVTLDRNNLVKVTQEQDFIRDELKRYEELLSETRAEKISLDIQMVSEDAVVRYLESKRSEEKKSRESLSHDEKKFFSECYTFIKDDILTFSGGYTDSNSSLDKSSQKMAEKMVSIKQLSEKIQKMYDEKMIIIEKNNFSRTIVDLQNKKLQLEDQLEKLRAETDCLFRKD